MADLRKEGFSKAVLDLIKESQEKLNERTDIKEFDVNYISSKEKKNERIRLYFKQNLNNFKEL